MGLKLEESTTFGIAPLFFSVPKKLQNIATMPLLPQGHR